MKLVSVIIPCFNAAPYIGRCVNSCFAQTYPNLEIILIDNNSTDESIAIARTEARKVNRNITVLECSNQGVKYARSMGNNAAQGQYIQLLDADDALGPYKIAQQVAALEKHREYSVAYCNWLWHFHGPGGKTHTVKFISKQFDDILLQLLLDNWHPPHAYLFRREVVEKINPAYSKDCGNSTSDDREFASLAALTGARFLYVPEVAAIYNNWSDQQITSRITPPQMAEALAHIFARLREYAENTSSANLQEIHRQLLNQPWKTYSLAPGDFSENHSIYTLMNKGKGSAIRISAFEAIIIKNLLHHSEKSFSLEHCARIILRLLHIRTQQALAPNLAPAEAYLRIIQQTNRLFSLHCKDIIAAHGFDQDQCMDIPEPMRVQFLLRGPLYLPTFPVQRLCILETLWKLCDKGILVEAH